MLVLQVAIMITMITSVLKILIALQPGVIQMFYYGKIHLKNTFMILRKTILITNKQCQRIFNQILRQKRMKKHTKMAKILKQGIKTLIEYNLYLIKEVQSPSQGQVGRHSKALHFLTEKTGNILNGFRIIQIKNEQFLTKIPLERILENERARIFNCKLSISSMKDINLNNFKRMI